MSATKGESRRAKWGIILIVWPFVGFFLAFLLYAIVNWMIGSTTGAPIQTGGSLQDGVDAAMGSSEDSSNIFVTIANVFLFILGASSLALGIPSIVMGIILLATRGSSSQPSSKAAKSGSSQGSGQSIAGMVLGISSLVLVMFLGFVLGVLAIIFSSIGLKRKEGKGFAITGLVTGILGTVASIFIGIGIIGASYALVQQTATDSSIKADASLTQKQAEIFYAENDRYPNLSEIRNEVEDVDADLVIGEQGASVSEDVIYIPCYGDGAIIWYWDSSIEEYKVVEIGHPEYCEWN